ncbi:MAG: NUDIX domain-containing protein [Bacteroidia bacterium]
MGEPEVYNREDFIQQMAIDCVIFGYEKTDLKVLIPKLDFAGDFWTLPGGFIGKEEGIDQAALRILENRTGIREIYLEQFKTYGDANRTNKIFFDKFYQLNQEKLSQEGFHEEDLKWLTERSVSIAYYALVDIRKVKPVKSSFDQSVQWYSIKTLPPMIMDHRQMVMDAREVLRIYLDRKLIAFNLLPETFTMRELQKLYEAVHDRAFPNNNFQKKMLGLNILERLGKKFTGAKNKAPYLYRFSNSNS